MTCQHLGLPQGKVWVSLGAPLALLLRPGGTPTQCREDKVEPILFHSQERKLKVGGKGRNDQPCQ